MRTNTMLAGKLMGAAAALVLCAGVAVAQYGPPPPVPGNGYDQYYHENGRANPGARMGWAAGFAQGQSDRDHGHSFRPTHTDQYKNVPESPEGYSRHLFKQQYRDAFVRGYSHGYGR